MTENKIERQIREAFIDGYLSAVDQFSPGRDATSWAERAWTAENTTNPAPRKAQSGRTP